MAILCAVSAVVLATGCKSAGLHHKEADEAATNAITQKQKELNLEEPFTIETKDRDLRRRVIIDQGLAHSSDASLSSQDVKRIKDFPEPPVVHPSTQPTIRAAQGAIRISLLESLQVAAYNSRDYQLQKENIFIDALALDLARDDFRLTFTGSAEGTLISDQSPVGTPNNGMVGSSSLGVSRKFSNGLSLASTLSFDIVKMLTRGKESSKGVALDTTISMPLLRGAGEEVVLEPLRQAERNVAYDLLEFQQFKRTFAVDIAQQYYNVISQYDQIRNAEAAYRRAIESTRRARRQADAGRLPEIQVDQSVQQELRARDRWIQAQSNLGRRLDSFKTALGLPPDADIELDAAELRRLNSVLESLLAPAVMEVEQQMQVAATTQSQAPLTQPAARSAEDLSSIVLPPPLVPPPGSLQADPQKAVDLALQHRPDLLVRNGEVNDAQRKVVVAADALQAGLTLQGDASMGGRRGSLSSASQRDATLNAGDGVYSTSLLLDLPLERTRERNDYRTQLIRFEQAVRDLQQAEDRIKADVRTSLRDLQTGREQIQIQAKSVAVAQKRVDSTNLFLDAGRAQIRDVLEAQDALVQAQNGLTSALINYRIAELALQRDMGMLDVNEKGMWKEYEPVLAGRELPK